MMQSEKFQCLECDYHATCTRNLAEYQNSEHKEDKFQCTECDYQAIQKDNLASHHKSIHKCESLF